MMVTADKSGSSRRRDHISPPQSQHESGSGGGGGGVVEQTTSSTAGGRRGTAGAVLAPKEEGTATFAAAACAASGVALTGAGVVNHAPQLPQFMRVAQPQSAMGDGADGATVGGAGAAAAAAEKEEEEMDNHQVLHDELAPAAAGAKLSTVGGRPARTSSSDVPAGREEEFRGFKASYEIEVRLEACAATTT